MHKTLGSKVNYLCIHADPPWMFYFGDCRYRIFFAYTHHKKDSNTQALALLVICGLLLRLFAASNSYLHAWDERYHALVAKHLIDHFLTPTLYEHPLLPYDYKNWTCNHIWLDKQPLALWLMALNIKVFGLHPWAVRIPSVLLSTIGIKLVYNIGKSLYNSNTAFIAAFLFSIHGLIIELTAGRTDTDHVDIAFLFFVLSGIWGSVNYSLKTVGSYLLYSLVFRPVQLFCQSGYLALSFGLSGLFSATIRFRGRKW